LRTAHCRNCRGTLLFIPTPGLRISAHGIYAAKGGRLSDGSGNPWTCKGKPPDEEPNNIYERNYTIATFISIPRQKMRSAFMLRRPLFILYGVEVIVRAADVGHAF
jgi:hypothetical protein